MKKVLLTTFLLCLIALGPSKAVFAADDTSGFTFTFEDKKFMVGADEVSSWKTSQGLPPQNILAQPPEPAQNYLLRFVGLNPAITNSPRIYNYNFGAVYNYIEHLAKDINLPAVEANLKIKNNTALEFTPSETGEELDIYKSAYDSLTRLQAGEKQSELTINEKKPERLLGQTNNLGITELIAEGVSGFAGSPNNRRHNIAVGLEKFKGVIIAKGEEFSFNKYLGPVEKENGFLPELVIKKTGTVPELGGGLCQVSSTTFRAAMQAGLPITERRNHAYAVQYYAPQGTDATIYPGIQDLKFINDTPGAILIWPYLKDKNTLVFDFYGTKDSRQVTLEKPVVTDRKDDGSMKASWTRQVVTADGKERTDVFKSTYASPALYHKTESFISSTGVQSGQSAPPATTPTLAPPI